MVTKRLQYAFNDKTFNPFDYGNSDYLTIVHTSKALQPKGELLDDKFIFKGASIVANRDKQQVPPLTGRPVLYISMGSTQLGNNVRFYRMCMNAFKNSRYQVIIAAGRYTDLNEIKDIPENVTVLSYAPQLEILKIASVFNNSCWFGKYKRGYCVWSAPCGSSSDDGCFFGRISGGTKADRPMYNLCTSM